jgi:hypothetical protein
MRAWVRIGGGMATKIASSQMNIEEMAQMIVVLGG